MQEKKRSNAERSGTTRGALIGEARRLFVERGYAATSTPQLAAAAGLSRGALYHQFADKRDLFRAVLATEAAAVAGAVEAVPADGPPIAALAAGAEAYMRAMRHPGRTRLLLIDGPAVLGAEAMHGIDAQTAARTLADGIAAARPDLPPGDIAILAELLSAMFDRAALAVLAGGDADAHARAAIRVLTDAVRGYGMSSDASP